MTVANDNEAACPYEVRAGGETTGRVYWYVARKGDKRKGGASEAISLRFPTRARAARCMNALIGFDQLYSGLDYRKQL